MGKQERRIFKEDFEKEAVRLLDNCCSGMIVGKGLV